MWDVVGCFVGSIGQAGAEATDYLEDETGELAGTIRIPHDKSARQRRATDQARHQYHYGMEIPLLARDIGVPTRLATQRARQLTTDSSALARNF